RGEAPARRPEPRPDAREERIEPSVAPQAPGDRRLRPALRGACSYGRPYARAAWRPAPRYRRLARLPACGPRAAPRDRASAGARRGRARVYRAGAGEAG